MGKSMKISDQTMGILKNFSTISPHLFIEKESNDIRSVTESRTFFAEAVVPETFPVTIGIDNLHKFLQTISMFESPVIEFNEAFMVIKEEKARMTFKYFFTAPASLTYPQKSAGGFDTPCSFILDENTLGQISQASRVSGLPDVKISYDNNVVRLDVLDRKASQTSNVFSVEVEGEGTEPTVALTTVATLKMIPGDYKMSFSKIGAKFESLLPAYPNLKYFLAMDVPNV